MTYKNICCTRLDDADFVSVKDDEIFQLFVITTSLPKQFTEQSRLFLRQQTMKSAHIHYTKVIVKIVNY